MKATPDALRTLLTQFFLALLGQPVPGSSRVEREQQVRKRRRLRTAEPPASPSGTLRTVAREAFRALVGQPSSSRARRKPRP
ncbi:hypothetical protein V3W47_06180 [Deinococcus sp. YIM 134068]|uniref:hypothetical protein n=1 Tax=Deinococcus lichenicola TaxID=3118910 RepID=UPI002F947CFC